MGYQLWTSELTGYRRRGTRISELRNILGQKITVSEICEPLLSCPLDAPANEMYQELRAREFDVAGVRESERDHVLGYVECRSLIGGLVQDHLKPIEQVGIIDDADPMVEAIQRLRHKPFLFVSVRGSVAGIITLADLNKPIVRVYLFGIVSLLEMHLAFWIRNEYPDDTWKNFISKERTVKAEEINAERPGLELIDCLQFGDRRKLFSKSEKVRNFFGFASIKHARKSLDAVEELRNDLAHSQYYLSSIEGWPEKIELLLWMEDLIHRSDDYVEHRAGAVSDVFKSRLW